MYVRMESQGGVESQPDLLIDVAAGLLPMTRVVQSPNCDDRPDAAALELIVIHGISLPPGEFGGGWVDALFTNSLPPRAHPYFESIAHLRVSAHVLIDRAGGFTQYVPFHMRAWHAGESCHCGRSACNDFSIGIELEGSDDIPYTDAQYSSLHRIINALRAAYPTLRHADIVGHCDIAPGRKTDPGPAFDWTRLRTLTHIA